MTKNTIMFNITAGAGAVAKSYSRVLRRPWKLKNIYVAFPPGCNRLVEVRAFVANDDQAETGANNDAQNILQDLSTTPYFVGDGDYRYIQHEQAVKERGKYIMLEATNNDGVDHVIDAFVEIEME